jgi:hypothetical protein
LRGVAIRAVVIGFLAEVPPLSGKDRTLLGRRRPALRATSGHPDAGPTADAQDLPLQ